MMVNCGGQLQHLLFDCDDILSYKEKRTRKYPSVVLIARIFSRPCGAQKNTTQLVKYPRVLSLKPSNIFDDRSGY